MTVVATPPDLPRLLLVSTGGTITMTPGQQPGIAPTLSGDDLVAAVPALARHATLDVRSFSAKPGASLTLEDLVCLGAILDGRLAGDCAGAIVVQGTDTIEETAFVLDQIVRSDRPVVVTGAMRGAAAPGADGPANLLAAAIVAGSREVVGLGTLVVLNDEVHAARFVRKSHTSLPSAFDSPGAGPLGHVVENAFRLSTRVARVPPLPRPHDLSDSAVALAKVTLSDDGRLLAALPSLGFHGAVIEAMGAGHVPAWLAPRVGELARTMPVVLATRVPAGPVFTGTYGFPGSEIDLVGRGAIPAGALAAVKAAALLRLLIALGARRDAIAARFAACGGLAAPLP